MVILNPRRAVWDPSGPAFEAQVRWELDGLERADRVLFYFAPGSQAPITLFELGLVCRVPQKALVVCPDGYWRKGNVDVVCDRYGVERCATLEEAIARI
jgi:hypothetical protein